MLFRLLMLSMIAVQVMLFAPGCEQIKDYRKRAYYEKSLSLYETQQYREALEQTSNALVFDPDYLDAVVLRGMCQYELKNYKSAGFSFDDAFFLDDTRIDLGLKAADAWFRKPKFAKANIITSKLLAQYPDNFEIRCLHARIGLRSRRLKLWANVDSILQPLLDDQEYKNKAFALLAEFNILNDNLEAAEQILMGHVDVNDDWFFVMRMLASKYDSLDGHQAQIKIYRKILELKPDSTQDIEQLLALLRSTGRKNEEYQLLDSLIAADEQQIRYKLALINFYIQYGHFAEAEEYIRSGLDGEAGYFDFLRYLIELYEKTNRSAAAIQFAKDGLGQIEEEEGVLKIEFMNILARLYYGDKNLEMAKAVVRWILDLDGGNLTARFLLSRISLDEGRTLLAIAELRRLVSEDAENPEFNYYMGLAHMARNEDAAAEASFKAALVRDPSFKSAVIKIVKIYFEKEYFVDAERIINEFLVINPDDPDVLVLQVECANRMSVVPERVEFQWQSPGN